MSRKENRMKTKSKEIIVLVSILIIAIIVAVILFVLNYINKNNSNEQVGGTPIGNVQAQDVKPQEIIDIYKGDDRPIAIMLDNHKGAWPHAGINKAYCVYEIIVEGGESRLMALFKGEDLKEIGPVRSSRHYFLDYALENEAIYVHHGWSPQAENDISKLKVNNINGISENSKHFYRVKTKSAPHNLFTKTEFIKTIAERKGYDLKSDSTSVLHYVDKEVELESELLANTITIPYSELHTVSYKYDAEAKRYVRYARGQVQTDYSTKENVTAKNIIITFAENYTLKDAENKGRQGLKNIGTMDGYYITNGKAIKIKCQKDSRAAKTIYKDLEGNVIDVNDGNTFINICPLDSNVIIE